MRKEYDVIIVGASVSGLCMANFLAKKGINILIIDLKKIKDIGNGIDDKIVTEESIDFLKNAFDIRIPAKFIENKVEKIHIGSINQSCVEVNTNYYIVNKKLFSAYLLGKIIELENVSVLEKHEIFDLLEEDKKIVGVKVKDISRGINLDFFGKIIVDASGSTAIIRRKIKPNRFFLNELDDFDTAVYYQESLKTNGTNIVPKLLFDPSSIKAGYVFITPKKDSLVLGIGINEKTKNIKKLFTDYKNELINPENETTLLESSKGIIPLRRPLDSFVYRNIMLLGDSACQVNPLVNNDISYGLKGSYFASKAILDALKNSIINTQSLWSYNTNFMRELGAKCAFLECIRDFFSSLSTEEFDFIFNENIIPSSLIENLDDKLNRRDVIFNNARLFLKPKLFHKFLKLSDYSKNMKFLYDNYPSYDDFAVWKQKLGENLENIRKSFLV